MGDRDLLEAVFESERPILVAEIRLAGLDELADAILERTKAAFFRAGRRAPARRSRLEALLSRVFGDQLAAARLERYDVIVRARVGEPVSHAADCPRHRGRSVLLHCRPRAPDRRPDLQLDPAHPNHPVQGELLLALRGAVVPPQRALLPGPVHLPALRNPHPVRNLVPEGHGDEDWPPRVHQHGVHL